MALIKHLTWQFEYIRYDEVVQRLVKNLNCDGCNDANCNTEDDLTLLDQVAYFDSLFSIDNLIAPVKHVVLARLLPPALAEVLDIVEDDSFFPVLGGVWLRAAQIGGELFNVVCL